MNEAFNIRDLNVLARIAERKLLSVKVFQKRKGPLKGIWFERRTYQTPSGKRTTEQVFGGLIAKRQRFIKSILKLAK